jgi:hypothetical protein
MLLHPASGISTFKRITFFLTHSGLGGQREK